MGSKKVVIPHLVGFDSIDLNFRSANKLMHLEYLADNVEYEATRGILQATMDHKDRTGEIERCAALKPLRLELAAKVRAALADDHDSWQVRRAELVAAGARGPELRKALYERDKALKRCLRELKAEYDQKAAPIEERQASIRQESYLEFLVGLADYYEARGEEVPHKYADAKKWMQKHVKVST